MHPSELPRLGVISNWKKDYLGDFVDLSAMSVLCIGYSEAEISELVLKYSPRAVTVLTLWEDHIDAQGNKFPIVVGDITQRTPFPDGKFDAVLSLSLLEHVSDLDAALIEMKRITRPGGVVCAFFGPAWSCAYGHHLYTKAADPLLDFSQWQMPAFLHLLCTHDELRSWYHDQGYTKEQTDEVLHWFYDVPIINRVPYDDYVRAFNQHFKLERQELMTLDVPNKLLKILRTMHGWQDFSTYGGKYLLRV